MYSCQGLGSLCQQVFPHEANEIRATRPREGVFAFGPHEKWGEIKKVEGEGWDRGPKKGPLARKPLDFEKRLLVFTVEFIY